VPFLKAERLATVSDLAFARRRGLGFDLSFDGTRPHLIGRTCTRSSDNATTGIVLVSETLYLGSEAQSGVSRGTPSAREIAFSAASVLWSV
jgi:hypothetical protein